MYLNEYKNKIRVLVHGKHLGYVIADDFFGGEPDFLVQYDDASVLDDGDNGRMWVRVENLELI